jgi:hypothetical protein
MNILLTVMRKKIDSKDDCVVEDQSWRQTAFAVDIVTAEGKSELFC